MSDDKNPLRVFCKNCGSPAGFNILKQSYACPHCGETSGIEDVRKSICEWRTLQKNSTAEKISDQKLMICSCSTCGAEIVFGEGEASETCDFCGSKLIRHEFNDPERCQRFPSLSQKLLTKISFYRLFLFQESLFFLTSKML